MVLTGLYVLGTLFDGWLGKESTKRQHRGCACVRPYSPDMMFPWTRPDPNPPAALGTTRRYDQQQQPVGGDANGPQVAPRYPGAGDVGGDGFQPSRTRFTRSSSSLEQVLEETGPVYCQESALVPAATCCIRRARRLTEYRNSHQHHHHYLQYNQNHQPPPPPQELPPGSSALSSTSGSSLGPPIVFNPPGVEWQRSQAAALRMTVEYPLTTSSPAGGRGTTFAPNVPPRRCRPVAGDGNCLFRALSWWITGSEEQHMEVRQSIVDELRRDGGRQYESVAQPDYVDESRIDTEGVWGSDVEIFVAATMLRTPIAVYSAFGDHQYLWQVFQPVERNEAGAAGPAVNEAGHLIYLQNSNSHFEPVVDI